MTDSNGPDDVQQLQDRIRELEQRLASQEATTRSQSAGGENVAKALKIIAIALVGLNALLFGPALITLRRWRDWWR